MLGRSVEKTWQRERGGADAGVEKSSIINLSGSYFLFNKTVANFEDDG